MGNIYTTVISYYHWKNISARESHKLQRPRSSKNLEIIQYLGKFNFAKAINMLVNIIAKSRQYRVNLHDVPFYGIDRILTYHLFIRSCSRYYSNQLKQLYTISFNLIFVFIIINRRWVWELNNYGFIISLYRKPRICKPVIFWVAK